MDTQKKTSSNNRKKTFLKIEREDSKQIPFYIEIVCPTKKYADRFGRKT